MKVTLVILLISPQSVQGQFPHQGNYIGLDSNTTENYSQFNNKVMLIEAFATWCLPCKAEQHELSLVDATLNVEQENITIFSLSVSPATDTLDDIQTFKDEAEQEFDFTANWEFGLDTRQGDKPSFAETFEITVIPTTILINAAGTVEKQWEGVVTAEEILLFVDENIEFEPPNQAEILARAIFGNILFQGFLVLIILLAIYRFVVPNAPKS